MARKLWSFPSFFVDPSNSTGLANDLNGGLTATTPILTTNELNKRLYQRDVTVNATITYLSDDPGATLLDVSTMSIGLTGTGSLTFQGTPQVSHTGGVFNVGTNAINPATNQRQTAHTSDLATFAPFVFSGLGGGSTHPQYVIDTTNPNLGNNAWIVSGAATASLSRPVQPNYFAGPGGISNGDGYRIQRGSVLAVAYAPITPGLSAGALNFNDFAFSASSLNPHNVTYTRCSFDSGFGADGTLINCFLGSGIVNVEGGTLVILSGVLVVTDIDVCVTSLATAGDPYFTGATLIASPGVYSGIFASSGIGAGIQFQDIASPGGAILVAGSGNLDVTSAATGTAKLWGSGNTGPGIAINPGATLTVSAANPPNVTGSNDFGFTGQNGSGLITVARAVQNGAYTEAGGAATRTTTWAHFAATIGAGGFGFQAHDPDTNAAIVGI